MGFSRTKHRMQPKVEMPTAWYWLFEELLRLGILLILFLTKGDLIDTFDDWRVGICWYDAKSPFVKLLILTSTILLFQVVFQALARLHGSWLKWSRKVGPEQKADGIRTEDIEALSISFPPWTIKSMMKPCARLSSYGSRLPVSVKWIFKCLF